MQAQRTHNMITMKYSVLVRELKARNLGDGVAGGWGHPLAIACLLPRQSPLMI